MKKYKELQYQLEFIGLKTYAKIPSFDYKMKINLLNMSQVMSFKGEFDAKGIGRLNDRISLDIGDLDNMLELEFFNSEETEYLGNCKISLEKLVKLERKWLYIEKERNILGKILIKFFRIEKMETTEIIEKDKHLCFYKIKFDPELSIDFNIMLIKVTHGDEEYIIDQNFVINPKKKMVYFDDIKIKLNTKFRFIIKFHIESYKESQESNSQSFFHSTFNTHDIPMNAK